MFDSRNPTPSHGEQEVPVSNPANVESCPVCEGTDHHYVFTERQHDLLGCKQCELLFISPYPRMVDQYSTVEDYDYDELEILGAEKHYRSAQFFYDQYFPRIRSACGDGKSILDVGCGTGCLLERMATVDGMHREGIELNSARAKFAREKAGCEVHSVPIEAFETDKKFDVVTLINVFSHVPDVNGLIPAIRKVMNDDGRLIMKVGEMAPTVRKDAMFDWQIPDHLQFMGLGFSKHLAERHGFEIERCDRVKWGDELFSKERWLAPGRSGLRNFVKKCAVYTPLLLGQLRSRYNRKHDGSIYSSLLVLRLA